MNPDAARRDLDTLHSIFEDSPISPIFTQVLDQVLLINGDKSSQKKDYALRQPFLDPFPFAVFEDFEDPHLRDVLLQALETRHKLFKDEKLGVDLMGFETMKDLFQMIKYSRGLLKEFPSIGIHNFVLPKNDAFLDGEKVVNDGDALLADVRLMPHKGWGAPIFKQLRHLLSIKIFVDFNYHIQTGALGGMLRHYGEKPDKSYMNCWHPGHIAGIKAVNFVLPLLEEQREKKAKNPVLL